MQSQIKPELVEQIKKEVNLIAFIDLSNVLGWQSKLKWNFDVREIIKQLQTISNISEIRIYYGLNDKTETEHLKSNGFISKMRKTGAIVITKPVKWIKKEITADFLIKQSTLSTFENKTLIEKIKEIIAMMKAKGKNFVEEPKCNFDVEMSLDILDRLDQVSGIVIFSGDSDFAEVIKRAKVKNKRIYLFGVRNSVAKELWELIDVYIDFGLWFNGIRKRSQNNINKMQKSPNKGGLRDISEKI